MAYTQGAYLDVRTSLFMFDRIKRWHCTVDVLGAGERRYGLGRETQHGTTGSSFSRRSTFAVLFCIPEKYEEIVTSDF